jgi:hypothetical protein
MRTHCPLVIIRWLDSTQPSPSWRHISDLPRTRAIECATVGWLLRDDSDVKVVCQSVGDLDNAKNAQASGIMTIPARSVLSIECLTEDGVSISSAGPAIAGSGSVGPSALGPAGPALGSAPTPREIESHPA